MAPKVLLERSIKCPCCGQEAVLPFANPRLYVANEREDDQHILSYTWLHDIKTDVLPHYYMVWQCPLCLFSDFKENILDFKKTSKNLALIEFYCALKDKPEFNVLKALRRFSVKGYTADAVIARHISAIFINKLIQDPDKIDHHKIGRLYLRLGWIFRELNPIKKQESESDFNNEGYQQTVESLIKALEFMENNYQSLAENLNQIRQISIKRNEEENNGSGSKNDPYSGIIDNLEQKIKNLRSAIELTRQTIMRDKDGDLVFNGILEGDESSKLYQKLSGLLPLWPEMPIDEKNAMLKAADAFDYSLRLDNSERNDDQEMSLINLIMRIQLKLGNLNNALNYVTQIYKMGFRDKQVLQKRINMGKQHKTINEYDERMIRKKIGKITATISRMGESRKQIFELIYLQKKEKIEETVQQNTGANVEEFTNIFKSAGITSEIIPYLVEKGLIQENIKKGFIRRK